LAIPRFVRGGEKWHHFRRSPAEPVEPKYGQPSIIQGNSIFSF